MIMNVSSSSKYEGFCAYGEGELGKSDLSFWMNLPERTDGSKRVLEMEEGVTSVEQGFFELLPAITRIDLPKSLKSLNLNENELALFKKNEMTLCGEFDSYAERFARENGLHFIHSDIPFGSEGDYYAHGSQRITLRFRIDGSAYLYYESFSQGSSAGSSFGMEDRIELKSDFYKTMSQKDIADKCPGGVYDLVKNSQSLCAFLDKAKKKGGYSF